jgi:PhnB protein
MKTTLLPYLNFDGKTAEAMNFYQSIFGGELNLQTYGEAGMEEDAELGKRIIHADLRSELFSVMASDTHPEHSPPMSIGNNIHLSIIGSDEDMLTQYFYKLSEDGSIYMPLEKQFWGDIFGSLTDKFGINWMVNISSGDQG